MFEIEKREDGRFGWSFKISNGRVVAVSTETYPNVSRCKGDIERLLKACGEAPRIMVRV